MARLSEETNLNLSNQMEQSFDSPKPKISLTSSFNNDLKVVEETLNNTF